MKVADVGHNEEDLAGRGMSGGGVGDNWRGYRENTTEKAHMTVEGRETSEEEVRGGEIADEIRGGRLNRRC